MAATNSVTWRGCDGPLANGHDLLLLDLDGVVYVGRHAVPGAAEALAAAGPAGLKLAFVTNNASRPPAVVAEHLRELGIAAADEEVVNSAQEGAALMATLVPAGSDVLAVGGPGVTAALDELGLRPVTHCRDGVAGVLQGFGIDVGWRELAEATYAVSGGAVWVATNPDLTVPTPRGTAPGNGQLVAVVQRTTGLAPRVTGKPGPGLFRVAQQRLGGNRPLVVGDRLDTDIAGAHAAGLPSLLVLTGVSRLPELLAADPGERPTYLAEDLAGLWAGQPAVTAGADGTWRCGEVAAACRAGTLSVAGEPADRLELWRAAAAAVWATVDGGGEVDLAGAAQAVEAAGGLAGR